MIETDKKIVIIGAGLVGSLLAVMLRQKGHEVAIFEKRSDMRKAVGEVGRSINLVVTSRGVHALRQVNLWEKVKEITIPVFGRTMHDHDGKLTYQPYGRDEFECNFSVSRTGINMLLMDEAEDLGDKINFDSSLASIDFEKKELLFEDGRKESYDILFGTDGGGSVVRKELIQFVDGHEEIERFPGDYKEMLMPADSSGNYPIEKNALHIWPRGAEMLMALPNLDGSFTMTLYMPAKRFAEVSDPQSLESYFQSEYRDSIPLMPNYKKEYMENPQGFLGTVRCSPWYYEDSVCLLGDAAHAIVPFFGQGMNCGFEDCSYLVQFMKEEKKWAEVFKKYFEFQKPNADAIASMALENAIEMSEKVGDQKFLLKKKIEHKIENTFPEKYRSRYGMVTYTLIPYELAFKAGLIQQEILEELTQSLNHSEQIDMSKAEFLIENKFLPFVNQHKLELSRYRL